MRLSPGTGEPRRHNEVFWRRRSWVRCLSWLLLWAGWELSAFANEWGQWLGGPERNLGVALGVDSQRLPRFSERWRRPIGSGVAGLSVHGTNAVTGVTDGKQDVVILIDAGTGAERWRAPLGRTRKRGEGTPPGPLSTPALDAEATYAQALDGRLFSVGNADGKVRWEVNVKSQFKAFEPGYGFASSPLLCGELVVLLPAGSSGASVVALDRLTGAERWRVPLGSGTEYASATFAARADPPQIVAHVGRSMAGISPSQGRPIWRIDDVDGGLWTASVVSGGRVFMPLAGETQMLRLEGSPGRKVWGSPVFAGAMGPVVEVGGILVGHHRRRLTGLDAETGEQLWQLPDESDGQLLVYGPWLFFLNDRAGELCVLSVARSGVEFRSRQRILEPTRMESPLAYAHGTLFIRAVRELIALRVGQDG